jgi:hypothetical protein
MSTCPSDSHFDRCEMPLYENRNNLLTEQQGKNRPPLRKGTCSFKLFEFKPHRRSESMVRINVYENWIRGKKAPTAENN